MYISKVVIENSEYTFSICLGTKVFRRFKAEMNKKTRMN